MPDRKRAKGEVVPFAKLMAALTTLKRRERVSDFEMDVYEGALVDVPLNILSRAVQHWLTTETWFPTVAELLQGCEAVRVELRAAVKFQPCEHDDAPACSSEGWREQTVDGVRRMTRCDCWRVHQAKVAALGAPATPLALPPARTDDLTRVGED